MKIKYFGVVLFLFTALIVKGQNESVNLCNKGEWLFLDSTDLRLGKHHTQHNEIFGKYACGYNKYILEAIDSIQSKFPDGGGYFIGLKADPPESPIGYDLSLFGKPLLKAPRTTSYCSGSSYAAFIEALNLIYKDSNKTLSNENYEAMRMQELDNSRREDKVKFWGNWNADGYGNHFALVQYSKMGEVIEPKDARPGDFMNISWKSGNGHSVVFLGWYVDSDKDTNAVFWSSQKGTNGLADLFVNINSIAEVKFVRLVNPDFIFYNKFDNNVDYKIKGNTIEF